MVQRHCSNVTCSIATARIDSNKQQLQQLMEAAEADRAEHLQATQAALEDFGNQEQRLRDAKEKATVALADAKQELRTATAALNCQVDKLNEAGREIKVLEKEMQTLDRERREKRHRAKNGISVREFGGPAMEKLRGMMNKHESKFSRPPIGPLGYHLDLEDDKWGKAAQAAIGHLLDTVFVVHDWRDKQTLQVSTVAVVAQCCYYAHTRLGLTLAAEHGTRGWRAVGAHHHLQL